MRVWIQIVLIILTITPLASQGQTLILVKDICPGNCSSHRDENQYKNYPIMAEINGQYVFYAANRPTFQYNYELYVTDGTDAGTYLLKDIGPGPRSSLNLTNVFKVFMPFDDEVFFVADDSISGKEMWRTDGTTIGTNLLVDFNVGTGEGASPNYDHGIVNNTLIYRCDGGLGSRLCFLNTGSSFPDSTALGVGASSELIFAEDKVFFANDNSSSSATLWISDGTVAGTVSTGVTSNIRDLLFYYDGYVYYTTLDSVYNVYRSNGTVAGTNLVLAGKRPPYLGSTIQGSNQRYHISWNNKILMHVMHTLQNYELYISDGTEQGTYLLKEINTDSMFASPQNQPKMSSYPAWFCEYRNRVYFAAQSSEFDRELWVTDGTETGTIRVLDIFPGDSGSDPAEIQTIGSGLMFVATDSIHGRELWVSDGTAAGTRCLDLRPGPESSNIRNIYNTGTELYFFALLDTAIGTELYKMPLPVVDTTVSVNEIDLASKMVVWPNPATESIKVHVLQTGNEYISEINLIDLQGRVVASKRMAPNTLEAVIDVSALNSGIYFIEVTDAIGQTSKHKVVVAR